VTGILGYGIAIPRTRIAAEEILRVWGNTFIELIKDQLMVSERAVILPDEDAVTLAVESARMAIAASELPRETIGGVYFGTCTNPYDSRPSSTLICEALGLSGSSNCLDVQFSTKSGTAALQVALAMIRSGVHNSALAIGSDVLSRYTAPGSMQEYAASSGAATLLVGDEPGRVIAEIGAFSSVSSDLSDAFRLSGERYIRSGGMSTIESGIGVIEHIVLAVRHHLERVGLRPADLDQVIFHQPVGIVPIALAAKCGFSMEQVAESIIAYELGDLGSAGVGTALAAILDRAHPGQKILLASYGFGAGADVTIATVTEAIIDYRQRRRFAVEEQIANKILVDYALAAKYEGKFRKSDHALTAWL